MRNFFQTVVVAVEYGDRAVNEKKEEEINGLIKLNHWVTNKTKVQPSARELMVPGARNFPSRESDTLSIGLFAVA